MKPTTLLLLASLVANVALVSLVYTSRSGADQASARTVAKSTSGADATAKTTARTAASGATAAETAALSPEAARDLALGRAINRYAAAQRASAGKSGDGKWWVRTDASKLSREQREQLAAARRELSDALIAATGTDLMNGNAASDATLAFLPDAKRDQLRKILSDYQDMMEQYAPANGLQLASDREKSKLLRAERERDIAALLSPEELADYQMRTSPTADALRSRYGSAIASEEEFKKIYALQKAYDDKFPADALNGRITPDVLKARSDAAQQLQADMRAAVGDDAYTALKRASDSDLRNVDALATRLGLAADTVDRVATMRDSYAAESQRISADTATPVAQRNDQLKALAARAKSELASTLGTEGADAYAQRASWVSLLQSGVGFSTAPTANSTGGLALNSIGGATQSVFPVMPAAQPGVAVRQSINVISTDRSGDGGGGCSLFFSGAAPAQSISTQVISVGKVETHGPDDTGAAPTTRIIMTPAGEVPATATPPKE